MKRGSAIPSRNLGSEVNATSHTGVGWRYVLIELGIVTAGLFIALTLNSAVDWSHHRQAVRDARRNIHLEIHRNRRKVRENLGYVRKAQTQVDANIAALHLMIDGRFRHGTLGNGIDFDAFDETAWRAAADTNALSYMPFDEVQRYSGLYSTVEYVNARALTVAESQFDAIAPAEMGYDIAHLPPEEIKSMLRGNAAAKIKLETLTQILDELDIQLAREERDADRP